MIFILSKAICKDCTNYDDVGLLKSQTNQNICREIQISEIVEKFNFEIYTQYDAILKYDNKNVYVCNFIEKIEHDLANTEDYAYSCSLESQFSNIRIL